MKKTKQDKLKARGWKLGTAVDFLGLGADETALIEVKHALSDPSKRAPGALADQPEPGAYWSGKRKY